MPTVLDLHIHTTKAGPHSELAPLEMIEIGKRIGLSGVAITEHNRVWDSRETRALSEEHNFRVLRGLEVNTEMGHIAIFGLEEFVGGLHRMAELRRVADEIGGFLIVLHPFRRLLTPSRNNRGELVEPVTFERALEWPVWEYVDAIEVLNGANTDDENVLAYRVAQAIGRPGTGGSDAHSMHGIGCFTTCFPADLKDDKDLLEALKAGEFYPAQGLLSGQLARYEPELEEATL